MYAARPELGDKHACTACAARFYDLGRVPARCPVCGVEQPPPKVRTAPIPRGTGMRWSPRPSTPAPKAEPEDAADDTVPLLDASDPDDPDSDDEDTPEVEKPDEDA
ncbi:MAG: FYDLN acid domain-containing protein [Acetobacteraceae bacterium]|nr:FYDLN acid domain-containing protein [Acetobacteraceae bacterium]